MEAACSARLAPALSEPAGFSGRGAARASVVMSAGGARAAFGGSVARARLPRSRRTARGPAPVCVAMPDKKVDDPEENPEWFLRRPKHFDWWRSDWNPVNWDAEEWFKTNKEAPWVEHTQNLIDEGIPITGYQHDMKADELPFLAPPVLSEWEVYCRRQVDKQWEEQAKITKAAEAYDLIWEAQRHDNFYTDLRLIEARKRLPWPWRPDWTDEELTELVGMDEEQIAEVEKHTLKIGDPRWKVSYRDLRPMEHDELDFLRSIGRLVEADEDLPDYAEQPPYVVAARARAAQAALAAARAEGGADGDAAGDLGEEFRDFDTEFTGMDDVNVESAADLDIDEDDDSKF